MGGQQNGSEGKGSGAKPDSLSFSPHSAEAVSDTCCSQESRGEQLQVQTAPRTHCSQFRVSSLSCLPHFFQFNTSQSCSKRGSQLRKHPLDGPVVSEPAGLRGHSPGSLGTLVSKNWLCNIFSE